MIAYKQLAKETDELLDLASILEAYEDLAATKIQKVKADILACRDFYEGLARLSNSVGTDFADIGLEKKEAAIFVASNTGLYGDIIEKTFVTFLNFVKNKKVDIFIAGKLGESLLKNYAGHLKFVSLTLPDTVIDENLLKETVAKIISYRKIHVFYGKFKNLAFQYPKQATISGEFLPKTKQELEIMQNRNLNFIYEPSIEVISEIFTHEILASLLERLLKESLLARFASRLIHLDESLEKNSRVLKKLAFEKYNSKKKTLDRKQNAMISNLIIRT